MVSITGLLSIGAIYWFFFGKKEEAMNLSTTWDISVDGGYKPAVVTVPNGKTSTITFIRKDPSSCLEEVVIPDFKIKQFLPLNTPVSITISPTKPGTYSIHCGMNMFHGKVVVV